MYLYYTKYLAANLLFCTETVALYPAVPAFIAWQEEKAVATIFFTKVTEKTFQEMYINVGMANCEKRPKQERDDIRFTHIAIPTSFYILL